jgi:hypothetical protein
MGVAKLNRLAGEFLAFSSAEFLTQNNFPDCGDRDCLAWELA